MGYTRSGYRGYLSGFGAITATSIVTTGTATASRFLASSLGTAGAPAFAATTALDGGLYWINAGLTALAVSGGAMIYGSSAQLVSNIPHNFQSYLELTQIAAPSAGGATIARVYAVDAGASKNRVAVIFDTGAAQTVSTEP